MLHRSLALLALLVTAHLGAARADAPPPRADKKLSKEERARLKVEVAAAEKADKKGDHGAAAAAYERALAIKPDDDKLLVEMGWQLFQAKDLPRAEQVTRRAIAVEGAPGGPATLYNLGRILEAKGDKQGAFEAYVDSLDERPNRTVYAALAKLDPAAARDADPLRPRPMEGPFPTLAAYCATKDKTAGCSPDLDPFDYPALRLAKPAAPWLEAQAFREDQVGWCVLALRTERGWFVYPFAIDCDPEDLRLLVDELAVKELAGGPPPELSLRYTATHMKLEEYSFGEGESHMKRNPRDDDKLLIVCGLGPSKTPSCFKLPVGHDPNFLSGPKWDLSLSYGAADVDVTAEGDPTSEARAYVGKHPLRFP